jgi:hypothetical protein
MILKNPLTYPPRKQTKRQFHPSRDIPRESSSPFLFDRIFKHPVMRSLEKFSRHGIIPLLIGAAVTATGHSQMLVRSIALAMCAIWLSFDLGVWVSKKRWPNHKKAMIFSTLTCLICCSSIGIMYWFLDSTLEDQRIDVFQNLQGEVALPPSRYIMDSSFTFKNNGRTAIGSHQVSCKINSFYANDGKVSITDSQSTIVGDFRVPLEPGGDAQSDVCLGRIFSRDSLPDPKCGDITLQMYYVLETQPAYLQRKEFRFVADKKDDFTWHPQPVMMRDSPCKK